jgi:periplasmic copper chaperone A
MKMRGAVATMLAALMAYSVAVSAQEVAVQRAWVRATVPGQKATGAFMRLISKEDAALIGASSPVADTAEMHQMVLDDNIMKMRLLPKVDLPAGKMVEFKPGGYHVMLMDLKRTLRKGDTVPVTLKVEGKDGRAFSVSFKAEVLDINAVSDGH